MDLSLPLALFLLSSPAAPVNLQDSQPISTVQIPATITTLDTSEQKRIRSVFDKLDAISVSLSKTIIVEGIPQGSKLLMASEKLPTNTSMTGLKSLAEILGYDIQEQDGAVVLFQNFSDASDLPPIEFDEAVATLKQLRNVVTAATGTTGASSDVHNIADSGDRLVNVLQSIPPESLKKGVPVTSLSAEQRQACLTLLLRATYDATSKGLDRAEADLNVELRDTTVFTNDLETPALPVSFGYRYYDNATVAVSRSLNNPSARSLHNGSLYTPLVGYSQPLDRADAPDKLREATTPDATSRQNIAVKSYLNGSSAPPQVSSLKNTAERLSVPQESVVIAAPYATKPVTVFGFGLSPRLQVINALASMTGLRVIRQLDDKTKASIKYLVPTALSKIDDPANLAANLSSSLPKSLLRYTFNNLVQPSVVGLSAGPRRRYGQTSKQALGNTGRHVEIVKWLRTQLEPEFKMSRSGDVSATVLPDEAKSTLGLLALIDALDIANSELQRRTPISDYETKEIIGMTVRDDSGNPVKEKDGTYTYRILLGKRRKDGMVNLFALFALPIPKPLN